MSVRPVVRAVTGGVTRRKVQTVVIFTVLLVSTASATLGLGLLIDSSGPFQHAFTAQRGADVTAGVNQAKVTGAQLTATRRLPQVSAAAGPFAETAVTPEIDLNGGVTLPPITVVGRASPGGPVDDVTLDSGRWPRRPGEMVISRDSYGLPIGSHVTVTSAPGKPVLTVVGIGKSITDTADAWVLPGELPALRAPHAPAAAQMLYRFHSAGSPAQISSAVKAITAALPDGAVTATSSWLVVKSQEGGTIAIIVPFVVAFGVIGLAMSVLIVGNVVNGAVVAGYRRIGVLKSIGFTPAQVIAAYVAQAGLPALAGTAAGVLTGNALSVPLLSQTATVYGVGKLLIPPSVDIGVPLLLWALVGLAALLPALRAGRLSAVQAIATGRAPRTGHGYAAHRALGRLRLPRPVTIGLAAPFARPARTAVTAAAIGFGATAVIFAFGLRSTLNLAANGQSHASAEQVQVELQEHIGPSHGHPAPPVLPTAAQEHATEAAIRTSPGTLRWVAEAQTTVGVTGLSQPVITEAFRGDSAWTGYDLITGHWYTGPGQLVVNTGFLTQTGKTVGDGVTLSFGGRQITARIVGEVFDPRGRGEPAVITSWQTLGDGAAGLTVDQYDVGLRPGTDPASYATALNHVNDFQFFAAPNTSDSFYQVLIALIGTLTLLITVVAGLGVLNTVILGTRDRVHDLGVFKAVGMTPRQTIAMVVCWIVGAGLLAGLAAIPVGIALHASIVHAMANAGQTAVPASYINVFSPAELAALALAGLVIGVLGALLPASWAARAGTATALRAE